ncbi:SpoIIE family protein phosphatase [Salinivibrio sp. ES.052]|uniref:SpoIIE family protein phosphatase n=1 Tax=Salinivibrio sp. ES.052 TaxID=1882823 RepID=UPI00092BB922|nr:SpoIIE family protein phosphatase [Salinivibrio sp. ES.052]SIO04449.1 Histidine kinase-like ATPase domain-containing protein [Salinivibrio sp. ES.052]
MNVLVVDDEPALLHYIAAALKDEADNIILAMDGCEALSMLEKVDPGMFPDLIISDVNMPKINGFEMAAEIRGRHPQTLLPIVFLTGVDEQNTLTKCLEFGDDFLNKPVDIAALIAKIRTHFRHIRLFREVSHQRDQLKQFQETTVYEHAMASQIFERLMSFNVDGVPGINAFSGAFSLFNGDVTMVLHRPLGGLYIMIADATGHGLPAAISTIPAVKTFIATARRGLPVGDIAIEINEHIRSFMPVGTLLASVLLEVMPDGLSVNFWSGGLPDAYCLDQYGQVLTAYQGRHMALGAQGRGQFDATITRLQLKPGQRLFFATDGVIEARNHTGKQLGEVGLIRTLSGCQGSLIAQTQRTLTAFAGEAGVTDDVSMLELAFPIECPQRQDEEDVLQPYSIVPSTAQITFDTHLLKEADLITDLRGRVKGIVGESTDLDLICTVASELITNALDYGILGMQAVEKNDVDGLFHYFIQRQERLSALSDEHYILLELAYQPAENYFMMGLTHSGNGFDFEHQLHKKNHDADSLSGRGITLVRSICDKVTYSDEGRRVDVVFKLRRGR